MRLIQGSQGQENKLIGVRNSEPFLFKYIEKCADVLYTGE